MHCKCATLVLHVNVSYVFWYSGVVWSQCGGVTSIFES